MSLKSLLHSILGIPAREVPPVSTARLEGRSDWPASWGMAPADPHAPGGPLHGAPRQPNWWDNDQLQRDAAAYPASPPWPATDDPYAAPEPCPIVSDPALETLTDLRLQALQRPLDSVKSVTDLLHLIERQEAAELHLTKLGMTWTRERGWHLPDPYLA